MSIGSVKRWINFPVGGSHFGSGSFGYIYALLPFDDCQYNLRVVGKRRGVVIVTPRVRSTRRPQTEPTRWPRAGSWPPAEATDTWIATPTGTVMAPRALRWRSSGRRMSGRWSMRWRIGPRAERTSTAPRANGARALPVGAAAEGGVWRSRGTTRAATPADCPWHSTTPRSRRPGSCTSSAETRGRRRAAAGGAWAWRHRLPWTCRTGTRYTGWTRWSPCTRTRMRSETRRWCRHTCT